MVYLFHTTLVNMLDIFSDKQISDAYTFLLSKAGWMSVSFFFILSGFVISWSSPSVPTPLNFYKSGLQKYIP
ncbi:hypothetical protein RZP60_13005 [Samsonia erythrinae]